jgi:hypothetical protein
MAIITTYDSDEVMEGEEILEVRGSERWSERWSEATSVYRQSQTTNNFPLVASLIADPFRCQNRI